jgi:uncharacterized protein YndB with AHSA1/START domain
MTVSRKGSVGAGPEDVWRLVSDPEHLPRWWPGVGRVEEVTETAWTTVLRSPKGKTVRADYTLLEAEPPRRLSWRQEVEETPFERILGEAVTDVELEPAGEETLVALSARMRLRGFARLGFLQVRRATGQQLEEAIEGLQRALGAPGG